MFWRSLASDAPVREPRRRTVLGVALITGVLIGIVAVLFATREDVPVETVSSETISGDWTPRDVPDFAVDDLVADQRAVANDLTWKSQMLLAAGENGFAGDAGYRLIAGIAYDGGSRLKDLAERPVPDDPLAAAFDAGQNPFAMLAGSTRKSFARVEGVISLEGPVPEMPLLSAWSDPLCVMTAGAKDDSVVVNRGRVANAVVIAESLDPRWGGTLPSITEGPGTAFRPISPRPGGWSKFAMEIEECRLNPRVIIRDPGEALKVLARDSTSFDLSLLLATEVVATAAVTGPRGQVEMQTYSREGIFSIADARHPWLKGVAVFTASRSAVTTLDGRYAVSLVPGPYRLIVFHEVFGITQRVINVDGDATHDVVLHSESKNVAARQ